MGYINKDIPYTDLQGTLVPLPFFDGKNGETVQVKGDKAPYIQLIGPDGNPISSGNPINTSLTGSKATKAIIIPVGSSIEPTSAITANEDIDAQVIFSGDTAAVTVKLLAGVVYPYEIKKVVSGAGIVGLY